MNTSAAALVALALAVLLSACAQQEEQPPATSGIEGQVLLGPTCPVVREDRPCPDSPFQATIVLWNAQRTDKVHTFTTDADGRFRVPLAPGQYYIDPQPPDSGAPPSPTPQTVSVPPDQFVHVTIEYDSGIR